MSRSLTPYSEEWFKIVEERDPIRAHLIREHCVSAGNDNVCYECGRHTQMDYYVLAGGHDLQRRLCLICVKIYKDCFGEMSLEVVTLKQV